MTNIFGLTPEQERANLACIQAFEKLERARQRVSDVVLFNLLTSDYDNAIMRLRQAEYEYSNAQHAYRVVTE